MLENRFGLVILCPRKFLLQTLVKSSDNVDKTGKKCEENISVNNNLCVATKS